MQYRSDIDGLRAIAVLAVLFFHFEFETYSGGFLGVDIFFVISGYLITSIIKNQVEKDQFSFLLFYERRARRLLPALSITICLTCIPAYLYFSDELLESFGASVVHSTFSLSNIYFYMTSGYFANDAELLPLLHTWSLSVEEQFYLIWPLALVFLLKKYSKTVLFTIISILFLSSLGFSEFYTREGSELGFFMMPFRVFEFACGIVLALKSRDLNVKGTLADILCLLALAMIGFSFVKFDSTSAMPGLLSLPTCIATTIILALGGNSPLIGKFLLSNRLMVGIGKISYSLYLVHWPIYVFYKYIIFQDIVSIDQIYLFALSFGAAGLLYLFVEDPIRNRKYFLNLSASSFGLGTLFCLFIVTVIGANLWGKDGIIPKPKSMNNELLVYLKSQRKLTRAEAKRGICAAFSEELNNEKCINIKPDKRNVLILGDSLAASLYPGFIRAYPNINFSLSSLPGCRPIVKHTTKQPECRNRSKIMFIDKTFDFSSLNAVVLTGGFKTKEHADGIEEVAKIIGQQGPKVYNVGPVFYYKQSVSHVFNRFVTQEFEYIKNQILPSLVLDIQFEIDNYFQNITSASYEYFSVIGILCPENMPKSCAHTIPGTEKPLYPDKGHLTVDASSWVAKELKKNGLNFE